MRFLKGQWRRRKEDTLKAQPPWLSPPGEQDARGSHVSAELLHLSCTCLSIHFPCSAWSIQSLFLLHPESERQSGMGACPYNKPRQILTSIIGALMVSCSLHFAELRVEDTRDLETYFYNRATGNSTQGYKYLYDIMNLRKFFSPDLWWWTGNSQKLWVYFSFFIFIFCRCSNKVNGAIPGGGILSIVNFWPHCIHFNFMN